MEIQAPKGTRDVTPQESYIWQYVEGVIRELCRKYNFRETRTPVIEHTELFQRGVGDTTDVVQKEMYTFTDKGERSITLKPEGTAGVARMFIEQKLFNDAQPTKMYYLYCPVFRYEKPQAGRLREHHQFGIEIFGAPKASADAECIMLALELFSSLGIKDLQLNINSIGCPACRPNYNAKLREYYKSELNSLCPTCQGRLETNPLRILDCKEEKCREINKYAPSILDYLCFSCETHFNELKECLTAWKIPFKVNPYIVRGLDYYTKTVFEIISNHIGSQGTVCGGGRYDGLVEQLGGPQMNAVGFGLGMERLLMAAKSQEVGLGTPPRAEVYVAAMGEAARIEGLKLLKSIRDCGISAEFDHVGKSFKAQLKYADKQEAGFAVLIGGDELANRTATLKNMRSGEEETVPFDELVNIIISKQER